MIRDKSSDSDPGFQVTVSTLKTEAQTWGDQSVQMARIAQEADPLALGQLQSGIFQMISAANDSIVRQVVARATEGSLQMQEIFGALQETAITYSDNEQRVAASMKRIM